MEQITHAKYIECVNKAIKESRTVNAAAFEKATDLELLNLIVAFSWYRERIDQNNNPL